MLFSLNPELALITLIPIPMTALLVYRYVSKVRALWAAVRAHLSDLIALVQDSFSGIPVIKSFAQEHRRARLIEAQSLKFRDGSVTANRISILPAGIIEAAGGIGIVLVIWERRKNGTGRCNFRCGSLRLYRLHGAHLPAFSPTRLD